MEFAKSAVEAFPAAKHEEPRPLLFDCRDNMLHIARVEKAGGVVAQNIKRVRAALEICSRRIAAVDALKVDSIARHHSAKIGGGASRVVVS